MPRKVRELESDLRAGFVNRGGKGSHWNYSHPQLTRVVTVAGKPGDDAKSYLEREAAEAIAKVKP